MARLARAVPVMTPMMMQTRGFATEKQIAMRIVATSNLKKITSSMKMVSAAKMTADTKRLNAAIPFNKWATALCPQSVACEELDVASWPEKNLIICTTSDKGLCGGVNSFVTKAIRNIRADLEKEGKDFNLFVLGEKGRSQLRRANADKLLTAATDVLYPNTFSNIAAISSEIMAAGEFDAVHIVFNKFESAIAYTTSCKTLASLKGEGMDEPLATYEFEPETKSESLVDLSEFMLASQLYHASMENAASEQSSRTQAMENASKNAGELIDALTLQYNKARQARITTELIEIISGASALE